MNLNPLNFKWYTANSWPKNTFTSGVYILFLKEIILHDVLPNECLAMFFPSYRYGVAYEIYGISGEISGQHLGFISNECYRHKVGKHIDKKWLENNWDKLFKNTLTILEHVRFSSGEQPHADAPA
jgi:hypothetical protein